MREGGRNGCRVPESGRHSLSVSPEQEPGGVIEQHPHAGVAQLVAQPILVTVVHPL